MIRLAHTFGKAETLPINSALCSHREWQASVPTPERQEGPDPPQFFFFFLLWVKRFDIPELLDNFTFTSNFYFSPFIST